MPADTTVMELEDALHTLALVGRGNGHLDTVMQVKTQRAGEIEGESPRRFADGKARIDLLGYYFAGGTPTDVGTGQATGRRRYSAVRIVRSSDAASASLMSAFAANDKVTVLLSSFKSGGQDTANTDPVFSMELKEARIKAFAMLGGGALPGSGAMDVLEVVFGAIAIEAAPQSRTGQRGGVRSFSDSVG
jgi:type VI protein secretion system component Hcp